VLEEINLIDIICSQEEMMSMRLVVSWDIPDQQIDAMGEGLYDLMEGGIEIVENG